MSSEIVFETSRASSGNEFEDIVERREGNESVDSVSESESRVGYKTNDESNVVPKLGLEFESENHAYQYYVAYAATEGFGVRKDYVNKRVDGTIVSRRYTCSKEGYKSSKADTRKPQQDTRTGCLAQMNVSRQPDGKFCVFSLETKHNHVLATSVSDLLLSRKRINFSEAVEAELANGRDIHENGVPKVGMGFDSEDQAYKYYNAYAGQLGFIVRKDYINRSKIDGAVSSRRYTCFREGFKKRKRGDSKGSRPRQETRVGCTAQLVIIRQPDGVYRVTHFVESHNHELMPQCQIGVLQSQKKSIAIQHGSVNMALEAVVPVADFDPIDFRSKLLVKRTCDMKASEEDLILQHLRGKRSKDPTFFYAVQLDSEEKFANIFWADGKMILDYRDFGDVVCFDTIYRIKKNVRPFAPFLGVNNHGQMTMFGAALLYDETVESHRWVLRTFIKSMSGEKPLTILTDNYSPLAEAIRFELPGTTHRLCSWHIYRKMVDKFRQFGESLDSFCSDLSSCMFDHDNEEDFENAWKIMEETYNLLHFSVFLERKEEWAAPYVRNVFCAGIQSAQLSETFNPILQKCSRSETDVGQFFKLVGKVLNDWRYREIQANYDSRHHGPHVICDAVMLSHARDFFTPVVFCRFQAEYETCLNCSVDLCKQTGTTSLYRVEVYGTPRTHEVAYEPSENSITCSCMKFESEGILCGHSLKVLDYRNVKVVPDRYMLKRWSKNPRV